MKHGTNLKRVTLKCISMRFNLCSAIVIINCMTLTFDQRILIRSFLSLTGRLRHDFDVFGETLHHRRILDQWKDMTVTVTYSFVSMIVS